MVHCFCPVRMPEQSFSYLRWNKNLTSQHVFRGYKVVVKFFPNEAANLEPVVDMLLKLEEQA